MEYRYKEIYLEETIEEIFCKLNDSNIVEAVDEVREKRYK